MTEGHMARRYSILENIIDKEMRRKYLINLFDSFIEIRNEVTQEGIYTDSLPYAKRWLIKNISVNAKKADKRKKVEVINND